MNTDQEIVVLNNNNNNNLFYQESNTFDTIILKHFKKRTQLPKRPPKSTQAFQGETFEMKLGLESNFFVVKYL